jgi:hypothetical protein
MEMSKRMKEIAEQQPDHRSAKALERIAHAFERIATACEVLAREARNRPR